MAGPKGLPYGPEMACRSDDTRTKHSRTNVCAPASPTGAIGRSVASAVEPCARSSRRTRSPGAADVDSASELESPRPPWWCSPRMALDAIAGDNHDRRR